MKYVREQASVWLYSIAIALGLFTGYLDAHTKGDDLFGTLLLLLSFTFVFGLARPRHAWRWGIVIGLGVPVTHLVGLAFGYHAPYPIEPNIFATFLALLPAFIGAYSGALLRMVVKPPSVG